MQNFSHIYQFSNVSFSYSLGEKEVQALKNLDLEVLGEEFLCLTGPSGSGKSTLLNLLGLIEAPQKGSLLYRGIDLGALKEKQCNQIRRFEIGFIFQHFHLFPVLSAWENVLFFLQRQGLSLQEREERAKRALRDVGLWEHRHKRPFHMSGGQRQRVAIARALAKNPSVLIADEPTASLDQATGGEIMDLLNELRQKQGVTLIVASHDPMVHSRACRLLHLRDGSLMQEGSLC